MSRGGRRFAGTGLWRRNNKIVTASNPATIYGPLYTEAIDAVSLVDESTLVTSGSGPIYVDAWPALNGSGLEQPTAARRPTLAFDTYSDGRWDVMFDNTQTQFMAAVTASDWPMPSSGTATIMAVARMAYAGIGATRWMLDRWTGSAGFNVVQTSNNPPQFSAYASEHPSGANPGTRNISQGGYVHRFMAIRYHRGGGSNRNMSVGVRTGGSMNWSTVVAGPGSPPGIGGNSVKLTVGSVTTGQSTSNSFLGGIRYLALLGDGITDAQIDEQADWAITALGASDA